MSDRPPSGADDSPPLLIAPGEVHVWRTRLDGWPLSRVAELAQTLSSDEQARAARLVRPEDKSRFTIARAILRDILSRYTGVPPGELVFSQAQQGKPHLVQPSVALQFNVSHSADRMLAAVSDGPAVGVDIERLRALSDLMELAARFFAAREHSTLLSLEGWQRIRAFFDAWTRKEAVMKARGDGLTLPLDQVEVTLLPGESPRLLRLAGSVGEAECWSLHSVEVPEGFTAALAVEGGCERIIQRDWEG